VKLDIQSLTTLGALKQSNYEVISVKDELRRNLMIKLKNGEEIFPGIIGYEDTVIPELKNAILSKHDFILLGLRGQAKSRILRDLVNLLDDFMPIIAGSEINDNPFNPISRDSIEKIEKYGNDTPIEWIPRLQRYNEKLATPDVSIADLFGDLDPIKAATQRLTYANEGVIHFGIIPRTNRGIFVINELPDLQPRIQVGLLNILEEKDLQIRGFPLRIPLDILVAFSANPEDYTNRGNIITPLKDRIDSQIITHYPKTIEHGIMITQQEAWQDRDIEGKKSAHIPHYFREIVEYIAQEARQSELIDQKSGVSARLPISCLEILIGNAENRALIHGSNRIRLRISDLQALTPAITGKIELVYEGEQEGVINVARILIGKAIKTVFEKYFPLPRATDKNKVENMKPEFEAVLAWFAGENLISVNVQADDQGYIKSMEKAKPLEILARKYFPKEFISDNHDLAVVKELILEGLHQNSFLSKFETEGQTTYKDLVESIFNALPDEDNRDIDLYG